MKSRRNLFKTFAQMAIGVIAAPSVALAARKNLSILDAAYEPLEVTDDHLFCLSSTPSPQTLADLEYFKRKLLVSMRVPPSYLAMR